MSARVRIGPSGVPDGGMGRLYGPVSRADYLAALERRREARRLAAEAAGLDTRAGMADLTPEAVSEIARRVTGNERTKP
jgi:hypothetical protein